MEERDHRQSRCGRCKAVSHILLLLCAISHVYDRVTAIADKLGLDFALIHRKRDNKVRDAPEKMELLVGDVRGKVSLLRLLMTSISKLVLGCDPRGRHDRQRPYSEPRSPHLTRKRSQRHICPHFTRSPV